MADKPPGFSITKITYVYNSSLQMGFLAHLSNIEHEAKRLLPASLSAERKEVVENWKDLTSVYSPLQVMVDQEEQILHHAKVLPLWHGTSLPTIPIDLRIRLYLLWQTDILFWPWLR